MVYFRRFGHFYFPVFILSFFKNGVFRNSGKEKSPIHKTLQDLKNLEKKKYAEKGNYRMFYVELIDITRAFLVKQYHIPADVLLTDDLIDVMKHTNKKIGRASCRERVCQYV